MREDDAQWTDPDRCGQPQSHGRGGPLQYRPDARMAPGDGGRRGDRRLLPEQYRRLSARGPGPVARSSPRSGASWSASPARRRGCRRSSWSASRWRWAGDLQLRGGGHRGRILGLVPKEKLPTYNIFYEARTFSRGAPGLASRPTGVPFGDYVFALRLRHCWRSRSARTSGRRTARCAGAATRAPSWW